MATLEDVLVPMYLYHRYQVTAVAKSIGGLDYSFNLRGIKDSENAPEIVPAAQQRASIRAVLDTLSPQVLALPETSAQANSAASAGISDWSREFLAPHLASIRRARPAPKLLRK